MKKIKLPIFALCLCLGLLACQTEPEAPTAVPEAAVPAVDEQQSDAPEEAVAAADVPPTWTPQAVPDTPEPEATEPAPATSTTLPTATATATPLIPTNTPLPTATPVPTDTPVPPTNTPAPTSAAPIPTNTAVPANPGQPTGANLLPNPSFEGGHYNQNGIPELQLPNGWVFEWDEGPTGFGSEEWDKWVRPETRVLNTNFLPPAEHPLYIWDGTHTIKIFKGYGAISYRLLTDVALEPGTYEMRVSYYPDLVADYSGGQKIYSTDSAAGEIRIIADGRSTNWIFPAAFGSRNTNTFTFTIDSARTVRVGFAARGRFALNNNGWFMDDWSLRKLE
ncbi:MAG: hypothetical protein AAF614_13540 [Chloroflexota bacterium]